jgi:hypothetical protein
VSPLRTIARLAVRGDHLHDLGTEVVRGAEDELVDAPVDLLGLRVLRIARIGEKVVERDRRRFVETTEIVVHADDARAARVHVHDLEPRQRRERHPSLRFRELERRAPRGREPVLVRPLERRVHGLDRERLATRRRHGAHERKGGQGQEQDGVVPSQDPPS